MNGLTDRDFLVGTGLDVAAAAMNMRSIRGLEGTVEVAGASGLPLLRGAVRSGTSMPFELFLRDYLLPNSVKAGWATVTVAALYDLYFECSE